MPYIGEFGALCASVYEFYMTHPLPSSVVVVIVAFVSYLVLKWNLRFFRSARRLGRLYRGFRYFRALKSRIVASLRRRSRLPRGFVDVKNSHLGPHGQRVSRRGEEEHLLNETVADAERMSSWALNGMHQFYTAGDEGIFDRPLYCQVCEKLLVLSDDSKNSSNDDPSPSLAALECEICGYLCHEACLEQVKFQCKLISTTAATHHSADAEEKSSDDSASESSDDESQGEGVGVVGVKHQWMRGNHSSVHESCHVCYASNVGSLFGISGMHCLWCQRVVHEGCLDKAHPKMCDFGRYRQYVVPPQAVEWEPLQREHVSRPRTRSFSRRQRSDSKHAPSTEHKGRWVIQPEKLPGHVTRPLLVFVNCKSGGNYGAMVMHEFKRILNPLQVVALTPPPEYSDKEHIAFQTPSNTSNDANELSPVVEALLQFRHVRNFTVMVCGGDGTVGWVLSEMDTVLPLHTPTPQPATTSAGTRSQRHRRSSESKTADHDMRLRTHPPVGVIPFGTGNDLAQSLGWGAGYAGEDVSVILAALEQGYKCLVDQWNVDACEVEYPDGQLDALLQCLVPVGKQCHADSDGVACVFQARVGGNAVSLGTSDSATSSTTDKNNTKIANSRSNKNTTRPRSSASSKSNEGCKAGEVARRGAMLFRGRSEGGWIRVPLSEQWCGLRGVAQTVTDGSLQPAGRQSSVRGRVNKWAERAGAVVHEVRRERRVCNIYLGVGVDTEMAMRFHYLRETYPYLFLSQLSNKMWYGQIGAQAYFMPDRARPLDSAGVRIFVDGVEVDLREVEGVMFLNVPSYGGGINFWGSADRTFTPNENQIRSTQAHPHPGWSSGGDARSDDSSTSSSDNDESDGGSSDGSEPEHKGGGEAAFLRRRSPVRTRSRSRASSRHSTSSTGTTTRSEEKSAQTEAVPHAHVPSGCTNSLPQSTQDGLIEVLGVRHSLHMGQIQLGMVNGGTRLAQGRDILVVSHGWEDGSWACQVDGEPWLFHKQLTGTSKSAEKSTVPEGCKRLYVLRISHKGATVMLRRATAEIQAVYGAVDKAISQAVRGGCLTEAQVCGLDDRIMRSVGEALS